MTQLVRDLMTRDPVTMPARTPVRDAARAMREQDIGDGRDQLLTASPDEEADAAITRMREAAVRRIPVVVLSIGDAAIERDPALADISVEEGNT